jgi:hypothetical protein
MIRTIPIKTGINQIQEFIAFSGGAENPIFTTIPIPNPKRKTPAWCCVVVMLQSLFN